MGRERFDGEQAIAACPIRAQEICWRYCHVLDYIERKPTPSDTSRSRDEAHPQKKVGANPPLDSRRVADAAQVPTGCGDTAVPLGWCASRQTWSCVGVEKMRGYTTCVFVPCILTPSTSCGVHMLGYASQVDA